MKNAKVTEKQKQVTLIVKQDNNNIGRAIVLCGLAFERLPPRLLIDMEMKSGEGDGRRTTAPSANVLGKAEIAYPEFVAEITSGRNFDGNFILLDAGIGKKTEGLGRILGPLKAQHIAIETILVEGEAGLGASISDIKQFLSSHGMDAKDGEEVTAFSKFEIEVNGAIAEMHRRLLSLMG